jgi:hypothetical protein
MGHDTSGASPDKVGSGKVAGKDGDPTAEAAMRSGGESSGGAYPNAQSGKKDKTDGFMGHGGQTDIGYHGSGQVGDEDTAPGNANAPSD